MTAERIEHVLLAVTELASNTIRHTHGAGLLRMWQSGGDLMVQVSDEGSLPEVAGAAAVSRALPAPGAVGGYGLALVAQFSDEMLVHRAPATIRLRFRRS